MPPSLVVVHDWRKTVIRNSATILSIGSQLRLFYCSLNADADSFELWQVTMNNVEANLH